MQNNERNKEQATTRQGSVRALACYKEILKEKRSWSCQSSVLNFSSHLYCWTLKIMIQMTHLQFIRNFFLLKFSFVPLQIFANFLYVSLFSRSKQVARSCSPNFNIAFMGKSVLTHIISTNVSGHRINYDITSGDGFM